VQKTASRVAHVATASRFKFTRATVDAAECSPDKSQALFSDTEQPGLRLRVTASGARSFVFESKLARRTNIAC
jgi:hypothetical protein